MRRLLSFLSLGAIVASACSSSSDAPFSAAARDHAIVSAGQVDPEALRRHVAALVAGHRAETPLISPYNIQAPHTHLNSARYVEEVFAQTGLHPVVERTDEAGMPLSTVYVDIPGTLPELVLLTAHHDAWYQSAADDNSSAVAVLAEAARILKDTKPRRTIRIVAFDGEEEGLVGSMRYLAIHRADPVKIVVNMDCVAFASDAPGSQSAPPGLGLRDTGNFLAVLANERASGDVSRMIALASVVPEAGDVLGLITPADGSWPGTADFLRSDHAPFWQAGIPALFVTDTANFRNAHYHTPDDLPDTLDYAFLARSARLIIGTVTALAEND